MPDTIALIPGDGVGKEIFQQLTNVFFKLDLQNKIKTFNVGKERYEKTGHAIDDDTINEIKKCKTALFGAVSTPPGKLTNYRSPILTLRKELDLFINIRPNNNILKKDFGLNLTIFRENSEGLYIQKEYMSGNELAIAEKHVSKRATQRLAHYSYKYAQEKNINKMTIVQKSNVLKLSDRFFLDIILDIAKQYPEIETNTEYVDSTAYHMARNPERYDGIITTNLYGDILSDLAAGLGDGLGISPSYCFSENFAFFEPVHGSAPDIAGKNIASPYAVLLCLKALLLNIHETEKASRLNSAISSALSNKIFTPDLGGNYSLSDTIKYIEEHLES